MSDTLSNVANALVIKHSDGNHYGLASDGMLYHVVDGVKGEAIKVANPLRAKFDTALKAFEADKNEANKSLLEAAKTEYETALKPVAELKKGVAHTVLDAVEQGAIKDDVKVLVRQAVTEGHIKALGAEAEVLAPIEKAVKSANTIAGSTANADVVGKALLTSDKAKSLLTTEDMTKLRTAGFDFGRLDTFKSAKAELVSLIDKADGTFAQKYEDLLVKNFKDRKHLLMNETQLNAVYEKAGLNINPAEIASELQKKVSEATKAAEAEANNIVKLAGDIETQGKKLKPDAKVIDTLKANLAKAEGEFTKHTSGDLGKAAAGEMQSPLKEKLAKASKSAGDHLSKAEKSGVEAAKSGWFDFKHTKETLKIDEARKAGKGIEEIRALEGKVGSLRKTKIGLMVAGAAAVTYAAFAAFGNKGPGENADRVRAGRENEQAPARG